DQYRDQEDQAVDEPGEQAAPPLGERGGHPGRRCPRPRVRLAVPRLRVGGLLTISGVRLLLVVALLGVLLLVVAGLLPVRRLTVAVLGVALLTVLLGVLLRVVGGLLPVPGLRAVRALRVLLTLRAVLLLRWVVLRPSGTVRLCRGAVLLLTVTPG
ncbi:MAG: hypothetical protein IRY84_05430, partial [Thermobispora bispora]|nr:hypothetical protein [Thermobispora bispora]